MADEYKGIWEQKNVCSTSDESDTDSETEVSLHDLEQRGIVKPFTASANVVAAKKEPSASIAGKKRNGEQRMPTRRPNPNVLNRNALLARENRRKKKLYLESVENELQNARKTNRALIKALKRQVKVAQRLEREKRYYQNILANQSEISGLVTALNKRRVSIDQHVPRTEELFKDPPHREPLTSCCSSSSYEPEPYTSPFGEASHGSVAESGRNDFSEFLSLDFSTIPDFFTDLDTDAGGNFSPSSWNDLWNTDNLLTSEENHFPQIFTLGRDNNNVAADDHNYVISPERQTSSLDTPSLTSSPPPLIDSPPHNGASFPDESQGICLHLSRGKVSLEFCPACHFNSSSRDPPLQLFSDEMLA